MKSPKEEIPILRNVSDTAWLVAALRATESERPDALFNDPYARLLVGARGQAIVDSMSPGYDMSWFMAVRTALLDELILRTVKDKGINCVVNLACGLDTRCYRLPVPSHVHWFDVDLAGVMDYRASVLKDAASSCTVTTRSVDLSDDTARRNLLAEASQTGKNILVITEGLLPYLSVENVTALAADLLKETFVHTWISDYYSGKVWKQPGSDLMKRFAEANISIKFQPEEGIEFFPRHGWKITESRSFVDEGVKLGRNPPKLSTQPGASTPEFDPGSFWDDSRILVLTR